MSCDWPGRVTNRAAGSPSASERAAASMKGEVFSPAMTRVGTVTDFSRSSGSERSPTSLASHARGVSECLKGRSEWRIAHLGNDLGGHADGLGLVELNRVTTATLGNQVVQLCDQVGRNHR